MSEYSIATVSICGTLGTYLGNGLEKQYGVPYVQTLRPHGITGFEEWLRGIGKVIGKETDVEILHHWRLATIAERTADKYALLVTELLRLVGIEFTAPGDGGVDGMVVSSSVPEVTSAIREMAHTWFKVPLVVVEPGIRTGMPILYDNPKDVGADRVANAVGAIDLYGGPAIVVDLGTATTFDAISAAGEYLGGAITPGIAISMEALFAHAAALRRVELVEPRNVIGKSTVESIQSGAIYGYTGLVDSMCRRIVAELGPSAIIATGGLAGDRHSAVGDD